MVRRNILDMLLYNCKRNPNKIIFWQKIGDDYKPISWEKYIKDISVLSDFLLEIKIKEKEFVGIIAPNCYEWDMIEKSLFARKAIVVGIDDQSSKEEFDKIFSKLNIKTFFVYDIKTLKNIPKKILAKKNIKIILIHGNNKNTYSLENILKDKALNKALNKGLKQNVKGEDDAILVWTSGTTGESKAIMYKHSQISKACNVVSKIFKDSSLETKTGICWLPLYNMTSRILNLVHLNLDVETYFIKDPKNIMNEIQIINPNYLLGVPRFFEKIYEGFNEKLEQSSFTKKMLLNSSLSIKKHNILILNKIVDKIIIPKIRKALVGEKMHFMISGSAPISPQIIDFFAIFDVPIYQAYALSENTIPMAMNTPTSNKIGTVGKVLLGNYVKIDDKGEILVKGEGVFKGYYKDQNKNMFTNQGYYKTGDLGYFDDENCLVLNGRIKDIIKTSTGIRISPTEVENVYLQSPYIDQIIVVGNNKKFLSALVVPNFDLINKKQMNLDIVKSEMIKYSGYLSLHKQVKKYKILKKSFTINQKEVTKSFKLKRQFIIQKYNKIIEQMYER